MRPETLTPPTDRQESALSCSDVTVDFGGVRALDGVSFDVPPGQVCGLIGPNGAGKTTLLNAASRLQTLTGGSIRIAGRDVASLAPRDLVRFGVARTFQHAGLFPSLSVYDNILVGAAAPWSHRTATRVFGMPPPRRLERLFRERAEEVAELLGIQDLSRARVAELPYGSVKKVELARALASRPTLLMLDEPAGGLTQSDVEEFGSLIQQVRAALDLTVVIVEHHMGLVTSVCERLVVLDYGSMLADGAVAETLSSAAVTAAYFGTERPA